MSEVPPVTVDFETFAIEARPNYPPKPVGISIKYRGKKAHYYAFGHPTENNCTEAEARAAAAKAWRHAGGVIAQNWKFDCDVAEVHWGLKPPKWQKCHDTMFLIFLDDPNQQTFSLKPSAARLLGMPPDEQEAVRDWLMKHQPVKGVRITKSNWGAYIAYAPGKLVGKYANGDTIRTERVFDLLVKKNEKRGMLKSYDRERRLLPELLDMERRGVPVLHDKLARDVTKYQAVAKQVDSWLYGKLKLKTEINFNSGDQLFAAMKHAKMVDLKKALRTPTGKFQTNKAALLHCVRDKQLLAMLKYRAQLKTCLGTFMEPWLTTADTVRSLHKKPSREMAALFREKKSLIYTQWNQVKGDGRGGSTAGARTGRLSSTPNFQNIPKVFAHIFAHDEAHEPKAKRKGLPKCPVRGLPQLPNCRSYITCFPGHVLIDRDYSQQEPRILAHFDGGKLLQKYLEQPWIDFHDFAQQELAKVGLIYDRKPVKNTNLGLIYGMGIGTLAERNDMDVDEAKKLKGAIMRLYPGLKEMYQEAKRRAAAKEPVRTWGGREYYCEPPRVVEGRFRQFDYKLVNVLIQGSAADCTKEAILRYLERTRGRGWPLLLNVHDQLTASVPRKQADAAMRVMREAMESVEFDVKMLTEGSSGEVWSELKDTDKKGKELRRAA